MPELNRVNERKIVVGAAWFRPDQYALLRALSTDSDSMASTYDQWLADANDGMKQLRKQGIDARRIDVDVKDLVAWCEKEGKPLNGAARAAYASEKLRNSGT